MGGHADRRRGLVSVAVDSRNRASLEGMPFPDRLVVVVADRSDIPVDGIAANDFDYRVALHLGLLIAGSSALSILLPDTRRASRSADRKDGASPCLRIDVNPGSHRIE